jgi:hypothetical protein
MSLTWHASRNALLFGANEQKLSKKPFSTICESGCIASMQRRLRWRSTALRAGAGPWLSFGLIRMHINCACNSSRVKCVCQRWPWPRFCRKVMARSCAGKHNHIFARILLAIDGACRMHKIIAEKSLRHKPKFHTMNEQFVPKSLP